jgi:hypothetical protein
MDVVETFAERKGLLCIQDTGGNVAAFPVLNLNEAIP